MNNDTTPVAVPPAPPATAAPLSAREVVRRLGPAGPLAVIAATLPALGGFLLLLTTKDIVAPWLKSHGELGVLLYVAGFALFAGLALLPTYAQAIVGGWAFGFALGFPAALAGFVGGASLGYLIARQAAGDRVIRLIETQRKWAAVYQALLGSGTWRTLLLVTLVRVPMNSPFAITNLVLAATRVPPLIYVVGTLVGMAPRTAAAVMIGANLKELTFEGTGQRWLWLTSLAVTIGLVLLIGHLAGRALKRATAAPATT